MSEPDSPSAPKLISLDQLIQNVNSIAQILSKILGSLQDGGTNVFQPTNSLLTSISALSASGAVGQVFDIISLSPTLVGWTYRFGSMALQVFTGNGTYTPTAGMLYSLSGTVGGGAGGGGCANSTAGNQGSGGGGGGGSFALKLLTAAAVGASQAVIIGALASGGTAGNNNGTAGNDTSIGTLCIGKGGSVGGGAAANAAGVGGTGGVAGTGDITIVGGNGEDGWNATITTLTVRGGRGGGAGLGLGFGGAGARAAGGNSGTNYGGGGAGGSSLNAGGAAAGGAGAQGLAFLIDFVRA